MIQSIFIAIITAALVFSWVYWLVAAHYVHKFLCARAIPDLPPGEKPWLPAVSILKPMKGLDAQTLENFASFCLQNYPDFELLFGAVDADDPAVEVIEQLRGQFPKCNIRMILCSSGGANPKVGILRRLAAEATGRVLIASDSDMRVGRDYLRHVIAPLQNPHIGIVTCPYVATASQSLPACMEALYVNTTFLPGAILAGGFLRVTVGFGATLAMRSEDLSRIGGFGGFRDHLADDYELAARIVASGLKVHLSNDVVATPLGRRRWRGIWDREVRWARGLRVSSPFNYLGIPLTFTIPLAVLLIFCAGLSVATAVALLVSVALRIWVTVRVIGDTHRAAQAIPVAPSPPSHNWALIPIRDLLTALIWCVGLFGHHIVWRGTDFRLGSDGRLERIPAIKSHQWRPGWLTRLNSLSFIRWLDRTLRRRQGIYEFSHDPNCLLRLSCIKVDRNLRLADGTTLCAGDAIGDLHEWNEHLPIIPPDGPDMKWAVELQHGFHQSFRELAAYVSSEPAMQHIKAFRSATSFVGRNGNAQIARMVRRFNMELVDRPRPHGILAQFHELGENILFWMLARAFSPASVKGKGFLSRPRQELWISRQSLLAKYGEQAAALPAMTSPPDHRSISPGYHDDGHPWRHAPEQESHPVSRHVSVDWLKRHAG